MTCPTCYDERWVCADHRDRPWEGLLTEGDPRWCGCEAEGVPCPLCNNPTNPQDPPSVRMIAEADSD